MNSLRRATPDSEAVASSEDERPWPTAKSFGTLPRKENSVPGLGGTIWSTQKRDSFKMEKAAQRNAAREARLAAPNGSRSGLRGEATPSPAASDASGAIPFSIPLQPAPKAGRSMSHSQGQREVPPGASDHTVLPLGLLAEEADTESESELGPALTHTVSHPPIGTLQRTSTFPSAYESYYGGSNDKEHGHAVGGAQVGSRGDRRFDAAFANLSLDPAPRRAQWQSKLGWDDVPNVNESRRHSLADIPTRRGSTAGADNRPQMGGGSFWPDGAIYDWGPDAEDAQNHRDDQQLLQFGQVVPGANGAREQASRAEYLANMKYHDKDEQGRPFDIPNMYKVPFIKIDEHERSEQDRRGLIMPTPTAGVPWAGNGRPRRQLFIVSFKCSRVDCFFLLENTGLDIKEGDIVIVEADRGQDLGTVQHANVTQDEARLYKKKYGEEQYKWLMMFSKNNTQASVNPNAQIYGENRDGGGNRSNLLANAPPTMQGLPRDNFNTLKPKAIKRLANSHEIRMLSEKEGNEAKAKRACQQKVAHLHLDMEILDAEWQWDFQKLIFYYYADHYINFKDLITELYRIYKTRIWLSAINPASFSQHALGQPPSGIGPGAVVDQSANNSYSMMYGADPDPYGAVPPYQIGYETYTPNYPSIPGVANSFAPNMQQMGGAYPAYTDTAADPTPAIAPGVTPTGTAADYNYYYDRSGMVTAEPNAPNAFARAPVNAMQNPFFNPAVVPPNGFYGRLNADISRNERNGPANRRGLGANFQRAPLVADIGYHAQFNVPMAPIGTRPDSSGNANAHVATSNTGNATAPEFVPGRHSEWNNIPTTTSVREGREEVLQNYLRGLPAAAGEAARADARADEMSRER